MEKQLILEGAGYTVKTIWECEWSKQKALMAQARRKAIEQQASDEHIQIRDALFGGRTECVNTYVKCTQGQKIFHFDITSEYPTVNALDDYPVDFKQVYKPTIEEIMDDSFIGIVKCSVVPPKDLYIPVLPDRVKAADGSEQLMFHLKPMKGVWASVELKKAIEKGYKITILAGYKYKRYTGLMKGYVEKFLKMKTCNGGVLSKEECDKLNHEHKQLGLDILISPNETSNNPRMNEIAKLCLNSLCGKYGQRSNLESYEFYDESKYNVFINRLLSNKIATKGWNIINENCVEHRFCENDEDIIEGSNISEITAIFTTANARMRLYSFFGLVRPIPNYILRY